MTEAERHSVEAETCTGIGHTGPKGYLAGELRLYSPEPKPEPVPETDPEAG